MAITPEVKQQWIAALRAGAHQQDAGSEQCCALGVLVSLAMPAEPARKRRFRFRLPFVIISRKRLEEMEEW